LLVLKQPAADGRRKVKAFLEQERAFLESLDRRNLWVSVLSDEPRKKLP